MTNCRQCGKKLKIKYTDKQKEIARKNLDHFPKHLAEEGQFMDPDVKSKIKRIMYESQLCLNGETDFANALCDDCKTAQLASQANRPSDSSFIDLEKFKEQSDAFMRKWQSDELIRKIKRGY
jgi:hypothetical protein